MMVQHLETEMELNGLLALNETNITGVHQIKVQETQQAHAMDADNLAMLSKTAEK